ncbi:SCO family protein [Gayadomonas joobiniege]|uniref:SCO family protein n=1 Tax=Gayadomonas joobiniege TaxID=1234606 RepID=UPI00036DACC5|nr:SCO family protein [Gayadomonas joobiniege]
MKRLLIGICLFVLVGCQPNKTSFDNLLVYPEGKTLQAFTVMDHHENTFDNQSLKGHWSILFLGFTFCPDICPTTLTDLNRVYPELKKIDEKVQVLLLTADPSRDTPARLKAYIEFFNPEFVALRAPHKDLLPFTRNLGLVYAMHGEGDDYLINHSASLVIIGPDGRIRAMLKPDAGGVPPSVDLSQLPAVVKYLKNTL